MKKTNLLTITSAAAIALTFNACDVDQTKEGDMPEVKVEGGEMPEYDVDAAEVKVGTTEETMEVPKVEMEEETVSVPTVGIEMPEDDDAETVEEVEEVEVEPTPVAE
ncbi:MAG: hypothetical protein WA771_11035 [Chthoniobacterales bacterium]